MLEPNPTGGELVDRPVDVRDAEVEDGERRRNVVGLWVDPDPGAGSENAAMEA
jgi:hypothetical protein